MPASAVQRIEKVERFFPGAIFQQVQRIKAAVVGADKPGRAVKLDDPVGDRGRRQGLEDLARAGDPENFAALALVGAGVDFHRCALVYVVVFGLGLGAGFAGARAPSGRPGRWGWYLVGKLGLQPGE